MTRPEVNPVKYTEVRRLHTGDIIQLTTGEKVIFNYCKIKDFIGTKEDGKSYSIFINKFDKVIEKAKSKTQSKTDSKEDIVRQLNIGDKIKLTDGSLVEFIEVKRTRFSGKINGEVYSIPFEMYDSKLDKNADITNNIKKSSRAGRPKESIWCNCENKEYAMNAIYVEHYKGVNHGWICPHCRKFTQIG